MHESQQRLSKVNSTTRNISPRPFQTPLRLCKPFFHRYTALLSPCRRANLLLEEGMLQCLRRRDPLVGVDSQAAVQEVMEMVEVSGLGLVHAARCDHEARAEIPSWLHHGQNSDCCLQVQKSRLALRTLSRQGGNLAKKGSGRIDMGGKKDASPMQKLAGPHERVAVAEEWTPIYRRSGK